ncbi:MAG: hypothetical protein DHS20C01_05650 [marine bacterium B5-7]|nr:MAG: hypothetical protein DHS20C01_05650 [marine bacterium B5-7]
MPALILLGIGALALVIAVSLFKEQIAKWWHQQSNSGDETSSFGGLIRSRDFFFDKGSVKHGDEPVLGRLEEDAYDNGDNLLDPVVERESPEDEVFDDLLATDEIEELADHAIEQSVSGTDLQDLDEKPSVINVRQLDYWVRIVGEEPVDRDAILSIYRQQEYLMERTHGIHGRALGSGEWCNVEKEPASTSFTDLVLTVQLCDRTGPADESELTRFNNLVFSLSESLDRKFKFQCSVEEALERARILDRFCQENDVLAIINICGEGDRQFRGPEVLRAVEGSGMRYGDMKMFHGPESTASEPLYSLANMVKPGVFELEKMKDFTTPGLTMFMSVPRCANPGDVFSRMAYVAGKISRQLGGVMLDQKQQPLDEAEIKQIRRQVDDMDRSMTEQGLRPGSEEALRLF